MTWGPLPPYIGDFPERRGRFIDIEIVGGISIQGDILSTNWNGARPVNLSSAADSAATAGYAFDTSAGAIQVQTIYAEGGEIGGLDIVNNITMATGGVFRTASSGERIQIDRTDRDRIRFFTGDNFEAVSGIIRHSDDGTDGTTRRLGMHIFAPASTGDTSGTHVDIYGESEDDSSTPPTVAWKYDGGSSQTPEFRLDDNFILGFEGLGSDTAPVIGIGSNFDDGIYSPADGQLGFTIGGTLKTRLATHLHLFNSAHYRDDGPATTGTAANATWINTSGSIYEIRRSTSTEQDKTRINRNVDYLANFDLTGVNTKHWRSDDKRWRYSPTAESMAAVDPLLGEYDADGNLIHYDINGTISVLIAKVNKLEAEVLELRNG